MKPHQIYVQNSVGIFSKLKLEFLYNSVIPLRIAKKKRKENTKKYLQFKKTFIHCSIVCDDGKLWKQLNKLKWSINFSFDLRPSVPDEKILEEKWKTLARTSLNSNEMILCIEENVNFHICSNLWKFKLI